MQNLAQNLTDLHHKLVQFHEQIELELDVDVWAKRSQRIKDLLHKTKAFLPSKSKKEQQHFLKLQKYLARHQTPKNEGDLGGLGHILLEFFAMVIIPFGISSFMGISIIGGLCLICLLIVWRVRANKRNTLRSKLRAIKRDVRYLARIVEYEYLNQKAT